MRQIILVAALVTALIAAALGFDFISAGNTPAEQIRLAVGWLSWSAALVVLSWLVGDR